MKILITGGAGYIGSFVVRELLNAKYEVVVIDNLSTGNRQAIDNRAIFCQGNLKDQQFLEDVFDNHKFIGVIHLAAKLLVAESALKPNFYFENNVSYTNNLLKIMQKFQVKNIVFSSTAAVYGESQNNEPFKEDFALGPINVYGQSKLSAEWLIQGWANVNHFNYVIFRYFNVSGAALDSSIGESPKNKQSTHLIPLVVQAMINPDKPLTIFGNNYPTFDGTCVRDYIHVEDLAHAHLLGLKHTLKQKSGIFNLGSKNGYSVTEIVKASQKIMKHNNFSIGPKRLGDPGFLVADNSLAKQVLKFDIKHDLSEIINSEFNWQKQKKF